MLNTILIAVASKHGSTREIGETIADELRKMRINATCCLVEEVTDLSDYDAVVLGSAVYMGHWMPEAVGFVFDHEASLGSVPVWLFSSGPLSNDGTIPVDTPSQVLDLMETIDAREHRTFAGKLDSHDLRLAERLVTKVVHAPVGDFRDWSAIRAWARGIGQAQPKRLVHDVAS